MRKFSLFLNLRKITCVKQSLTASVHTKHSLARTGKNPDIGVEGGKIILTGNGPFKGKTLKTALDAADFFD